MKLRGRVSKKMLYTGTKSEHQGIVLRTPKGELKLRRRMCNPFKDKIIEQLVGNEIEGEGIIRNNQFLIDHWKIIE